VRGWWASRARAALPLGAAILVLAGAADLRLGSGDGDVARRVFLVDVSPSVADDPAEHLRTLEGRIAESAAGAGRVSVLAFDGSARPLVLDAPPRLVAPGSLSSSAASLAAEAEEETDLESAFDAALARLEDRSGDVVVLSDFAETRGDALAAAARAGRRGVPIRGVVVGRARLADVRIESLLAPVSASGGSRVEIAVTVASRLRGKGLARIDLFRGGALVASREIALEGRDSARADFEDTLPESGAAEYVARATLDPRGEERDAFPRNDLLSSVVRVAGPPRVAVARDGGALAAALRESRLTIVPLEAGGGAIGSADAVVLDDVELGAPAFSPETAAAVRDFTLAGGLLVAAGAEHAFGPGLWRGSAVEDVLPVDCRPRDRSPLDLLVVLDASGSMASEAKFDRACAGARSVLAALEPGDSAGLVAFRDAVAAETASLPFEDARREIEDALARLEPRGGTRLGPALEAALSRMGSGASGGRDRLVLLLSDGLSDSDDAASLSALAGRFRAAGASVEAVATGSEVDADRLLSLGRVTVAREPGEIGRKLLEGLARRDLDAEAREVRPGRDLPGDPERHGFEPFAVGRLARTTPKPRAEILYETLEGDPVVAACRSGAGRAIAIPADLEGAGGARVLDLALGRIVLAARESAASSARAVTADVRTTARGVAVTVRGIPEGSPVPDSVRLEPGGSLHDVIPIAPGRVEATLDGIGPGKGQAVFLAGGEPWLRIPLPERCPREYGDHGDPLAAARGIARASGGSIEALDRLDLMPPPPRGRRPSGAESMKPAPTALVIAGLAALLAHLVLRGRAGRRAPPDPLTSKGGGRR